TTLVFTFEDSGCGESSGARWSVGTSRFGGRGALLALVALVVSLDTGSRGRGRWDGLREGRDAFDGGGTPGGLVELFSGLNVDERTCAMPDLDAVVDTQTG